MLGVWIENELAHAVMSGNNEAPNNGVPFTSREETLHGVSGPTITLCMYLTCMLARWEGITFSLSHINIPRVTEFWLDVAKKKTLWATAVLTAALHERCHLYCKRSSSRRIDDRTHTQCVWRQNVSALTANRPGRFAGGIHLMRLKLTFCGFVMSRQKSTANHRR